MKKTSLIAIVLVAVATVFTVSCSKKENSKIPIPESIDELWGTVWECRTVNEDLGINEFEENQAVRFSFIGVDSIVWATYQLSNGIIENSNSILVFTVTTYTKPDLFYTKLNNYFNGGFSDKPDKIEHQIPQKFCTFNGDGHLVSDILGETNLLYTKIK